jgi:PLD-like domain
MSKTAKASIKLNNKQTTTKTLNITKNHENSENEHHVPNNLHNIKFKADAYGETNQANHNTITPETECYFKNIESILLKKIKEADVVVGCVAWLTNKKIINALKEVKYGVQIIVQKEDFLRPDAKTFDKMNLYEDYKSIGICELGHNYGNDGVRTNSIIDELNTSSVLNITNAIRCVGNYNIDKKIAWPRMHNKFLIFCKKESSYDDNDGYEYEHLMPYAVWTGSLNLTETSMKSFENAVLIKNKEICEAYVNEWGQIFALSEELNWDKPWCEPEFRVGT